jgi:hypothetical protein
MQSNFKLPAFLINYDLNPLNWIRKFFIDVNTFLFIKKTIRENKDTPEWASYKLVYNEFGVIGMVVNIPQEVQLRAERENTRMYGKNETWPNIKEEYYRYIVEEISPLVHDYFVRIDLHSVLEFEVRKIEEQGACSYLVLFMPNYLILRWKNIFRLFGFSAILYYLEVRFGFLTSIWNFLYWN